MSKRTTTKKPKICAILDCKQPRAAEGDLCARHRKMDGAPVCYLSPKGRGKPQDCCDRPGLFTVTLEDEKNGEHQDVKVCEAHYRRIKNGSKKWDGPLNRVGGELVAVNTRIRPEAREAIAAKCLPGQAPFSKMAEILEQWAARHGDVSSAA